jgi:uncharacterized membrane protein YesL
MLCIALLRLSCLSRLCYPRQLTIPAAITLTAHACFLLILPRLLMLYTLLLAAFPACACSKRCVSMLEECRSVDCYEKLNRISEGTYGVVYR